MGEDRNGRGRELGNGSWRAQMGNLETGELGHGTGGRGMRAMARAENKTFGPIITSGDIAFLQDLSIGFRLLHNLMNTFKRVW